MQALAGCPLFLAFQAFGGEEGTSAADKFGAWDQHVVLLAGLSAFLVMVPLLAAFAVKSGARSLRVFVYLSFLHVPVGTLCAYAAHLRFRNERIAA